VDVPSEAPLTAWKGTGAKSRFLAREEISTSHLATRLDRYSLLDFQQMVQESMNTYLQMFNIPHSYLQEGMRLAREDAPGSPQESGAGRDPKEDQYRRSAGQEA
jgi:hypothetical protein